jgi:hypothetical protein
LQIGQMVRVVLMLFTIKREMKVRTFTIKMSDVAKCPAQRLDVEHYHEDGTCKCRRHPDAVVIEAISSWGTHNTERLQAAVDALGAAVGALLSNAERGYVLTEQDRSLCADAELLAKHITLAPRR